MPGIPTLHRDVSESGRPLQVEQIKKLRVETTTPALFRHDSSSLRAGV